MRVCELDGPCLEEQTKLSRQVADEMPKVQALLDSVKMLELRDWQVASISRAAMIKPPP